jgi:hypothetical protein
MAMAEAALTRQMRLLMRDQVEVTSTKSPTDNVAPVTVKTVSVALVAADSGVGALAGVGAAVGEAGMAVGAAEGVAVGAIVGAAGGAAVAGLVLPPPIVKGEAGAGLWACSDGTIRAMDKAMRLGVVFMLGSRWGGLGGWAVAGGFAAFATLFKGAACAVREHAWHGFACAGLGQR